MLSSLRFDSGIPMLALMGGKGDNLAVFWGDDGKPLPQVILILWSSGNYWELTLSSMPQRKNTQRRAPRGDLLRLI